MPTPNHHAASKTLSLKQKIILLGTSLLVTLAVLEIFLRLGGAVFNFVQERGNKTSFSSGEYRILCLGESTTALGGVDAYPFQLEEILQNKRPDLKIKVINKGMVSRTTADILAALPGFLKKYQPQAVVVMMGINDRAEVKANPFVKAWRWASRNIRVVHLFDLLGSHLKHKIAWMRGDPPPGDHEGKIPGLVPVEDQRNLNSKASSLKMIALCDRMAKGLEMRLGQSRNKDEKIEIVKQLARLKIRQAWFYVSLGHYHLIRDDCAQAKPYYARALVYEPDNYGALTELAECLEKDGQCQQAVGLYKKASQDQVNTVLSQMGLGRCYDQLGQKDEAYKIFQGLMKNDKDIFKFRQDIGDWFAKNSHWAEAEAVFRQGIADHPEDYFLYERLAKVLEAQGNPAEAGQYEQQARVLSERVEGYLPETADNYRALVKEISRRGIKVVCMQYPLRRIDPLNDILGNQPGVSFVDNRENFQQAIRAGQYSDYFSDSFAGYFGHCTRRGNRLIAENLAHVLTEKVLP